MKTRVPWNTTKTVIVEAVNAGAETAEEISSVLLSQGCASTPKAMVAYLNRAMKEHAIDCTAPRGQRFVAAPFGTNQKPQAEQDSERLVRRKSYLGIVD